MIKRGGGVDKDYKTCRRKMEREGGGEREREKRGSPFLLSS